MKSEEFNNLSKEEQVKEIEKCQSFEYFYNNYCKKEGMPEYSEQVWQEYIETNKKERFSRRRGAEFNFSYPFTPEESYKSSIEEKCSHENISREDGLDECMDCGIRNF